MPTTTTMSNDYERRFQRSLQKLAIPTWYADTSPSSKLLTDSKQSMVSTPMMPWKNQYRETVRTPEIIHVRRPHSYRSCRSSLATSPSPSIHSWHPNHLADGMNFSLSRPSSSSRRYNKYQKGIERVSSSSRWYQPTQFEATKSSTGIIKPRTAAAAATNESHYDTPKIYQTNENLTPESSSAVTNGNVNEQHNNNNTITNLKEQDNPIQSDESQLMPLVKLKEPFSQIEFDENDHNHLLERVANDLVESVLADILLIKAADDDEDQNTGVRELSEDENGLRELDENDMSDTDEFIVIGTQSQPSDIPPYNLNRLYTFSKINEENSKQNSPRFNDQFFHTSPLCPKQHIHFDKFIDSMMCPSNSHLSTHQSSEGVNEDTARIGRLLLESMQIPLIEKTPPTSARSRNTQFVLAERNADQSLIIEEYDDEFPEKVRRDSAYSSNQERIHIQQSIYEPLSECYSGYSFIQSDFLTPNISSIQSTTDEAYESEPTTMSSSIATTAHVHPGLEHEFEYPVPPPPVPDRRLKPTHLKASPPSIKPRLNKQDNTDSIGYSTVQKTKPLPITTIQKFLHATSNESTSPSTRTMSSRHYCGSIPVSHEETTTSSIKSALIKANEQSNEKTKDKRNGRTLNCLHPATKDDHDKRNRSTKSSSLSKTKTKKHKLITDIDEVTNGLAIRLPAPVEPTKKLKTSTPSSSKRANLPAKFYETSV